MRSHSYAEYNEYGSTSGVDISLLKRMKSGLCDEIGNTPLIDLEKFPRSSNIRLYAKLEGFNPGGSSKDRAALNMIRSGVISGNIQKNTTIIESSSGNMAIGLAMICSYLGLRFICVVDSKTTPMNINILRLYQADVRIVTDPDPETGELLTARLNLVRKILKSDESIYWTNQYANPANAAGQAQTMREIDEVFSGDIDFLFCATSTCGTIRGCFDYIREKRLRTKIVAVDALGSSIFSSEKHPRLIPGLGASIVPELVNPVDPWRIVHVSDVNCVHGCSALLSLEGILAGGSSGGVAAAFSSVEEIIPSGSVCVLILADRGERYLDSVYSPEWVNALNVVPL